MAGCVLVSVREGVLRDKWANGAAHFSSFVGDPLGSVSSLEGGLLFVEEEHAILFRTDPGRVRCFHWQ